MWPAVRMIASSERCGTCKFFRENADQGNAANDGNGNGAGECRRKLPELAIMPGASVRVASRETTPQLTIQTYWPPVNARQYCGQYRRAGGAFAWLKALFSR